jgi:hypothetical protein
MFTAFILAVVFFGMFLTAHAAIFHFAKPERKFRSMLLTFLFFAAVYAAVLVTLPEKAVLCADRFVPEEISGLALSVYLHFFLWYFYFHSLIVADRSISIRMLVEILKRHGAGASPDDIKRSYSLEEKFRDEIRDMLFLDRFTQEGEDYYNTGKASMQARVFVYLRNFMGLSEDPGNSGE